MNPPTIAWLNRCRRLAKDWECLNRNALAFLRWAENPRDRVAGFRVVQLLPGVRPATAARVLDRVAEHSDPMRGLSDFTPPAAAVEYWPSFVDAVQLVNGKSAGWPDELDLVCRWYAPRSAGRGRRVIGEPSD